MNCKFSISSRRRSAQDSATPNGFTLMELLIVIAIILILMLMAIPTIGSLKIKANETSAINSMQVVNKAQVQYSSTYGAQGFACTLQALGGDPKAGPASPTNAQILQQDLASGFKSGYVFTIKCGDKITANGIDRYNSYTVTAVPESKGTTGNRGFCSDQFGTISVDPLGGTSCSQPLQ